MKMKKMWKGETAITHTHARAHTHSYQSHTTSTYRPAYLFLAYNIHILHTPHNISVPIPHLRTNQSHHTKLLATNPRCTSSPCPFSHPNNHTPHTVPPHSDTHTTHDSSHPKPTTSTYQPMYPAYQTPNSSPYPIPSPFTYHIYVPHTHIIHAPTHTHPS